jgi:dTDP-4-dehydrorhamnose reductase
VLTQPFQVTISYKEEMRLLVVGGSGYLGREVCRVASADGVEVLQVGHARGVGRALEIRDAAEVERLVGQTSPDAVVNLAYVQDGPDAWGVNVDGALNVARSAAAHGIRLVHMSTDVVFDGRKGAPYDEEDTPAPCTDYGRSKAEAERVVSTAAPAALIVRTSLIVGGPGCMPSPHELAALDPTFTFYVDEVRSPVQVSDLAGALLELAASDVAGVLHVAGADDLSRADLAELIRGAAVRRAPAPPERPLDCSLDSSRARTLLSTRLRGMRAVLASDR